MKVQLKYSKKPTSELNENLVDKIVWSYYNFEIFGAVVRFPYLILDFGSEVNAMNARNNMENDLVKDVEQEDSYLYFKVEAIDSIDFQC